METPCINHDLHNALKWGLLEWLSDEKMMSSMFVVIESVRNGFSLIEEELSFWLTRVVLWVEEEDGLHPTVAATLWAAVGVEPKWVDHLVHMGVIWRDGRLHVSSKHRGSPEVWTELLNLVRHGLHFQKFSDSRWCTVGRSCRQLLHAQLLGLNSLVQAVIDDPDTSNYLIGGFRELSPAVQRFVSVAAFAAWPTEGLLEELLEDDRLCLHYQSYRDRLEREMDSLVAVPGPVWDLVADLVPRGEGELPGPMLRSLALGCAHTSLGFIQTRVWQHVESWPWIAVHP